MIDEREKERIIWDTKVEAINKLSAELQSKPDHCKRIFRDDVGSILNAYREGDVSFRDAVLRIKGIEFEKTKEGRMKSDCGDFGCSTIECGINDWDCVAIQVMRSLKHAWEHNADVEVTVKKRVAIKDE